MSRFVGSVSMDVADAAQLFVSRAEAVRADVDWVAHVDDLVQICERLDGIPLAIELAASAVALDDAG